jgi:hypothetical protein
MNNLKLSLIQVDESDSITRPMPLRKPLLQPLPRFSLTGANLEDAEAITLRMPPRRRRLSRSTPRVQRLGRWKRWPVAFYTLSAGLLLGAVLWFVVPPFGSAGRTGGDASPGRLAARVQRIIPAGSTEEPPPRVRAEDLPIVAPTDQRVVRGGAERP